MTDLPGPALVIVLEADPACADALAMLLADWGYECVLGDRLAVVADAASRRKAEARAIICDEHLGAESGLEAVDGLLQLGVAAPVLILAGGLRAQARRIAAACGGAVLDKPAPPQRLKAWLEQTSGHTR